VNVVRKFIPFLRPYAGLVVLTLVLSALFSLLSAVSVYIILPIMKFILPGTEAPAMQATSDGGFLDGLEAWLRNGITNVVVADGSAERSLLNLCILVVVLFVLKNVVKYLSNVTNTKIQQGVMKDIRDRLYERAVRLPLSYYNERRSGTMIATFTNEVSDLNAALLPTLAQLTRDPLTIISMLLLLLALSVKLTLIAFSTSILTVVLIRVLKYYVRRYSIRMQSALASITTRLQESFQNIRIIKAYAGEEQEAGRFRRETDRYTRSAIKHTLVQSLAGPIGEVIAIVALAVVLFYGGLQVIDGAMGAEELIAFLFLLFSIMTPIVNIVQIPTKIQRGVVAGERVLEMLGEQPEPSGGEAQADEISSTIAMHDVGFEYRAGEPVLRDINLHIARGETVALVGPSGGGKSTLADLLLRLYEPTEGEITLNGHDVREYDIAGYRTLVGVVTQESLLFNDTVHNNIAYNLPDCSRSDVERAARVANADEFIQALPDGYDTVIGDRGVLLSGGQRQRIAIARAIVRNPQLLLFDEATSALDNESEQLVQKAMEQVLKGRTAVVIAHRLSTIRNADRIVVVSDGVIKEMGSHEELLRHNGLYRRLYDAQFKEDDTIVRSD
jgi:subfamily B ATP-binding cassette protein MsbA